MFCGREHLVNKMGPRHVMVQAHLGPGRIEGDAVFHNVFRPLDHGGLAATRTPEEAHACQETKRPELAGCTPDLDDLVIGQCSAFRSASNPLRTSFFGLAIASE